MQYTSFDSNASDTAKGVAEREPMTRRREGGVLPKSEIFFWTFVLPNVRCQ